MVFVFFAGVLDTRHMIYEDVAPKDELKVTMQSKKPPQKP
jgi:hypothetical protein